MLLTTYRQTTPCSVDLPCELLLVVEMGSLLVVYSSHIPHLDPGIKCFSQVFCATNQTSQLAENKII